MAIEFVPFGRTFEESQPATCQRCQGEMFGLIGDRLCGVCGMPDQDNAAMRAKLMPQRVPPPKNQFAMGVVSGLESSVVTQAGPSQPPEAEK